MPRKPIPPMAWVLSGAVGIALTVLAVSAVSRSGQNVFYDNQSDAIFFRLTARHPFGSTGGFAALGQITEAPLRYGRIGLPFLAWVFALGNTAWVGWTLIALYIASIAAVPGVAAVLLDDLGAPPAAAAVVLLVPGLLLNHGHVYSDPLLIALLLLACVFEGRGRRTAALVVLACAILVKEVAILALLVWVAAALVKRDRRGAAVAATALLPYLLWCGWIRLHLGTFPFLADTQSRTGALGPPFVGLKDALAVPTPNIGVVTGALVVTVVLGACASWVGRGTRIGALAFVYTALTLCLGKISLAFLLENARVIAVAQVFALLCIVVAVSDWRRHTEMRPGNPGENPAENHGLFVDNAYL